MVSIIYHEWKTPKCLKEFWNRNCLVPERQGSRLRWFQNIIITDDPRRMKSTGLVRIIINECICRLDFRYGRFQLVRMEHQSNHFCDHYKKSVCHPRSQSVFKYLLFFYINKLSILISKYIHIYRGHQLIML